MRKKMWALLATLALTAALAVGCGGGGTSDEGMAPGQSSQPSVPSGTTPGGTTGQGSSDGK